MNKKLTASLLIAALTAISVLSACGKDSSDDSGSVLPTTPVDTTLTDLVGNYYTPCVSTANINSVAAYKKESISISSDATYSLIRSYWSTNTCTGTALMYILSPGTIALVGETSSPANGHLLSFTVTNTSISTTSSTAGRDHLNATCTGNIWNLNGGISTPADYSCPGDARFTTKGNGTVGYAAVVNNTTSISTTAISVNIPGILVQNSVATTTSLVWTK